LGIQRCPRYPYNHLNRIRDEYAKELIIKEKRIVWLCTFVKYDHSNKRTDYDTIEGTIKLTQNMPQCMQNVSDVDIMLGGLEPLTNYTIAIRNKQLNLTNYCNFAD
jgi:hypothetical protein